MHQFVFSKRWHRWLSASALWLMKKSYVTDRLSCCGGTPSPGDSLGAYDADGDSRVWLIIPPGKNQLQSGYVKRIWSGFQSHCLIAFGARGAGSLPQASLISPLILLLWQEMRHTDSGSVTTLRNLSHFLITLLWFDSVGLRGTSRCMAG